MDRSNRWWPVALLFFSLSLIFIGYYSIQNQFISILLPFIIAFTAFRFLYKSSDSDSAFNELFLILVLIKCILLFSFPHLSDDIYRFWWDGYLSNHDFNPYAFSPQTLITQIHDEELLKPLQKYYVHLNSPEYHTIYPLVCQWLFRISARISGDNIYIFNLVLKFIFLIADGLILYFLIKLTRIFQLPKKNVFLFWANPLCIIELNSNLHFEIFLILFFLVSVFLSVNRKWFHSGLQLGMSIVSKLISILWVPLFIRRSSLPKNLFLFLSGILIPVAIFLYSIFPTIRNYQDSIELYFQKFEFNSFLYKPLLTLFINQDWHQSKILLNLILPGLFGSIYLIIILRRWIKNSSFFPFKSAWMILFLYLLSSTTVHPWYIAPLIAFSIFTFSKSSFVWSFLILVSYIRYDHALLPYESILITLEYLTVVGFVIYESYDSNPAVENWTKK